MCVIAADRRGDKERPSAVFDEDGRKVGPGRRVGSSPFTEHDAGWRGANEAFVVIAADDLPSRAGLAFSKAFKPNEHLLFIGALAQLQWERLVYASFAGM